MQIQSTRFKIISLVLALALIVTPEMFAQQSGLALLGNRGCPTERHWRS